MENYILWSSLSGPLLYPQAWSLSSILKSTFQHFYVNCCFTLSQKLYSCLCIMSIGCFLLLTTSGTSANSHRTLSCRHRYLPRVKAIFCHPDIMYMPMVPHFPHSYSLDHFLSLHALLLGVTLKYTMVKISSWNLIAISLTIVTNGH